MNKREAEFIIQLPDGFDWQFMMDGKFIYGFNEKEIALYEIVNDELIQRTIKPYR